MRSSCLTIAVLSLATMFANRAHAQVDANTLARFEARRDLQTAKDRLRYYWQVEYPRQKRDMDAAVELTRMELENLNIQLREFRPFTQFSIGEPFPLTVRCLQMRIKEVELRLDNLQAERNALMRFHGNDFNALAADVTEARQRVLQLEPRGDDDSADAADTAAPLPAPAK